MLNPPSLNCMGHSYKWAAVSVVVIVVGGSESNSQENEKRTGMWKLSIKRVSET